ncbi:hypothetical protein TIFTF001_016510 [Ficus carica]|uniref:Ubiquitin-like protease family profile domain-containing protein n=1 Tax=Ficus carica TaxID=3494 RepID=A0AA88DIV1_FICCA|nr:hypothetical protein TIFTF001_016510 [Ficus carica]
MGKCWNGAKALYFPYNLYDILDINVAEKERGKHWVSMKVDLITAELVVFYCSWKFTEKVKLDRFMEPVQKMTPLLLQKSGYFSHLNPSPWPYRRPINHPQNEKSGDYAVYAIKYIEFDMQGQNFELINDATIKFYREKMSINIYRNDWVP